MLTWTLLDTATVPGTGERLRLLRRGTEYSIRLDDNELMGSRVRGSEEALARLGCEAIAAKPGCRVLIGGLGMGFTLRAALDLLPATASVVVAELVPAVVAWNRGPLAELGSVCLADPRVTIHDGDVAGPIGAARGTWDAILLDVDNGPEAATRASNDGLYDHAGLQAAFRALRPGGVLSVWSVAPDPAFTKRLGRSGFAVREVPVRANGKRGARHRIWLAARPAGGRSPSRETATV